MSSMKLLFRKTEVDLGNGRCLFAWRPLRNSIAVAGANRSVYLYERRGELIDVLELTAKIIGISWDCEGDVLAIITEGTSQLLLWDYNTKQADVVDISMGSREVASCITWSNNSPVLALGTHNGNLFIYNHRTARKIPSIGKHQRKVTGIVITRQDQIVSCAEDNTVIVSSCDGETVNTYPVSGSPSQLAVGEIKKGNGSTEIIISSVLNNKILFFMPIDNAEAQTNLQFQEKYGNIVSYKWFNEGLMILGFDKGFMVIISAHRSEIGTELNCFAEYKNYLSHTTTNDVFQYIINIGDNQIRIRDMEQGQDLQLMTDIETDKELDKVECSSDGQLVCVSSVSGAVSVYLTRMPVLTAARGDIIAILTSLSQITVHREGDRNKTRVIEAAVEPTLIAVGPLYAAVATNNKIWFYEYPNSNTGQLVRECEYLSTIVSVSLNTDYAAVVMEGKARLHKILDRDDEISITFPEPSRNTRLISACLTTHFLIFTTETNYIIYFSLEEWSVVSEYRHSSSIRHIAPDSTGLRCCVFDERMDTWVYSPVDDSMLKLPPVGPSVLYTSALWETFTIDRNTFIVFDTNNVYVFLVLKSQVEGESSVFIGTTKLPYGHTPLTLSKGIVQCITSGGKVSGVLLESHRTDTILESKKIEEVQELLSKALTLRRWNYAWKVCERTNQLEDWNLFAHATLHASDVELALRIFRHIGDVSMVFALERLLPIEDKNLLAGQIAVLLGRFDQAEELLLRSSMPIEALNLRRDLLDWPVALSLAEKLSPEEIPCIAKEYAQQLEFIGDYSLALAHYEKGVVEADDMNEKIMEHNEVCRAGVARMSIRTGDIRRGIQLAREQEGRLIKRDCAIALEQLKQLGESAELYELGQYYDRAAAVCLKAKAWGKVAELLPKVRSPKIHAQFGRVMESEKKYQKAAVAYKAARDYDNLVRVLLDHLDQAEEAVKIVRESRSVEGAKLVAKFFSKLGDHSSAIQFLVISQCQMEAFQLAETNDRMLDYAVAIDEFGTPEQYAQLGEYFANSGDMVNSGKFFKKAGHFNAALNQLIQAGDLREAYSEGIDTVAKSGDPNLMKKFKDYLLGELDGIPKDAHHLFRFYVALKQTREAAKTAIIIAVDEQENGKYTKAREVLFFMYRELISQNIRVPMEMENSLMLIHSYLLVKVLMGMEQWMRAARLICRVVSNISRFPAHIVPILTSAVVICSKAGLHNAALQAATQLMNPSYRNKIDAKYKKKIESLVRKGDRKKDPEDLKSPCFFCQVLVTEMDLHCSSCKNNLPYCILTGRHITAGDFALCSQCDFPGYYSEFKKHNTCPMCNAPTKEVIPGSSQAYMSKLKHQTARD